MRRFLMAGVIALATIAMPAAAWAAPFTGSVDYTGTHTPDNPNMNLATQSEIFGPGLVGNPEVVLATGSFGAFINTGDALDHQSPLQYRPFGGPYTPLWVHAPSGITFDLLTLAIQSSTPNTLVLIGTGLFTGAGFDPTDGLWNMTLNVATGALSGSFSSSSSVLAPPVVPEPTMLALFGLGLAAAGTTAARRRRRA
jgi:hypothetical protein